MSPLSPVVGTWAPRNVRGMQDGEMERRGRLAYAIRRAREKRGMTPPQLAERLGVARGTVNEWESGKSVPSMLYLGPLCVALSADPRLFADLPEEPPSPVDQYLIETAQEAARTGLQRAKRPRLVPPTDEPGPQ